MRTSPRSSVIGALVGLGALVLGRSTSAQGLLHGEHDATPARADEEAAELAARPTMAFVGMVLGLDGAPAQGAVVVSSAGGRAVTAADGSYRLEAPVPLEADSVQVTAVGSGGQSLLASTTVGLTTSGLQRVGSLRLSQGSTCDASWLPTFGEQPGTDGAVSALAVFDDGSGRALYVGGGFSFAGGTEASSVAKWDGSSWAPLGSGIRGGYVHDMTVFDDGGGPQLYVAGYFSQAGGAPGNYIAKWNGSTWGALGTGTGGTVHALAVFDDGSGQALYAGGAFLTAGGAGVNHVAKWNGATWAALGTGTSDIVYALAVFDDGSGPALYAGGAFLTAGGAAVNYVAKWDGTSWAPLRSGTNARVRALTVADDGQGPALFVGGDFTQAGITAAQHIARWKRPGGATLGAWATLGAGTNGAVWALTAFDDGSGPALCAGGLFTIAGGVAASRIAKWNGSSWSALGSGTNDTVFALGVYDDGSNGAALYAGGYFVAAGDVPASWIAKWDGTGWKATASGVNNSVEALTVFDDGGGPELYAAGALWGAGGVLIDGIGKWDGKTWQSVGQIDRVTDLSVFDDGNGPALYAGGLFIIAGGVLVNGIAKWDGSSWLALGGGVNSGVNALAVFDDGSGPALYAGGDFSTAGGVAASRIARWNGASWAPLGTGMPAGSSVDALAVFDDGSGPALYAGGHFTTAGGVAASRIAKWNGSSWSALGSGVNYAVLALTVFDDGSGPALFVGGGLISKWNGAGWAPLGSGVGGTVKTLTVFDDGCGSALYAAGSFTLAGGLAANKIARWNGSSWTPLGSGLGTQVFRDVNTLCVFDAGDGPYLYAGGGFGSAPDSGDSYLARWGVPDVVAPVLSCPPSILVGDRFGSAPGEVVTFTVAATDDRDRAPIVVCEPASGSLFPPGRTLVTCKATDRSGNASICRFPVTVARGIHR